MNDDNFQKARLRKLEERDLDKQAAIESAIKHLEPFARRDSVPIKELEELADEWEDAADYARENGVIQEYDGIMGCVDELRKVIEDHD